MFTDTSASRPAPQPVALRQMPQLDGVRALCLLSIVIHHWLGQWIHVDFPFEVGAFIFFALSGYLITRILLRGRRKICEQGTSLGHFLRSFTYRRGLRLAPAYALALVLYAVLGTPDVLQNWVWYVTNSSNLHFSRLAGWPGGADQFWTLAVDQQFYALWPFLVLLLPQRWLPVAMVLVGLVAPLSRYLCWLQEPFFVGELADKAPWFLTDHLCAGALLAYAQEYLRLPSRRVLWTGMIGALTVYLVLRYQMLGVSSHSVWLIWQQTSLALFSAALVGLCAGGFKGCGRWVLEHPVIQYIGTRSYGYYVYHSLVFLLLGYLTPWIFQWEATPLTITVRMLLGAVLLVTMAHYSWRFIEQPFLRRKQKHRYSTTKAVP